METNHKAQKSSHNFPFNPLHWPVVTQIENALRAQRHLLLDTIVLGVIGALAALVFNWMLSIVYKVLLTGIAGYVPPILPNEGGNLTAVVGRYGLLLIPISTTLGGLLSGLLVFSTAPEAEGHGTDTAVKAYHYQDGIIRNRVPLVKTIASAITIGSGGAAGREGPTALIAAGIGSIYARLMKRNLYERRVLLMIGMASGLAAIFRSPIGTAVFAVEVLYGGMEFEGSALLYTMLSSIIAYGIVGIFTGYQPIFQVPANLPAPGIAVFPWYLALGVAAGLLATIMPEVFYGIRDGFKKIPLPPHVKPAIGGLLVGLIALKFPLILSGGYGGIQMAIDGSLSGMTMIALAMMMVAGLSLTIGSGGSGGVFAPSLFVGAMLGGFLAKLTGQPTAAFAVVGMAAVFGGAARVPLATLLMVTEMTGGYTLLVPAGMAVMVSYLVQVALSSPLKYRSLYEAQVPVRFNSPAHELEQVENAFRILERNTIHFPASVDPIDLRSLLIMGAPISLPDDHKLVFLSLKANSPLVGEQFKDVFNNEDVGDKVRVIAFFREGHFVMPSPTSELSPGDRLLAVATDEGKHFLEENFESPVKVIKAGGKKVVG